MNETAYVIILFLSVLLPAQPLFTKDLAKEIAENKQVDWTELGSSDSEIIVTVDGAVHGKYSVPSIDYFFDAMNAAQKQGRYVCSGAELMIAYAGAKTSVFTVYDNRARYRALEEKKEECPYWGKFISNPLSLIDTVFSYETINRGIESCGAIGIDHFVTTINIVTQKKYALYDLVDTAFLIDNLKKDSWIRRKNKGQEEIHHQKYLKRLDGCEDLNSLANTIIQGKQLSVTEQNFYSSFAFHSYDNTENTINVRLLVYTEINPNSREKIQLGLSLKPKPGFTQTLHAINKKNSFFLGEYNNSLMNR